MDLRANQFATRRRASADRRTRAPRLAGCLIVALSLLLGVFGSAVEAYQPTQDPDTDSGGSVTSPGALTVVEVSGRLDAVLADYIERHLNLAADRGDLAVVLRINSPASVLPRERFIRLALAFRDSEVPTAVWVGPSGSKAHGGAAVLAGLADDLGVAPGASVGRISDYLDEASELGGRFGSLDERSEIVTDRLAPESAHTFDIVDEPTLPAFAATLAGVEITTDEDDRPLVTTRARSVGLPLASQLMHTVASPEIAYLGLIIGLGLLVFELFTAGVGLAGLLGAGSLVLGSYGLFSLPFRPWALALILFSMFAFSIDIQTGVPRFWSAVGSVLFIVGSIFLFDGVAWSWITLWVGIIGMLLSMLSGMPSMVRSRFSTPTIGREWMIGEMGVAATEISPTGVASLDGALWRAVANRATPIDEADRVRVVGIDRLLLEVEPETGGARDYRDRRPKD